MKAVLLAAGFGSRLRPITDTVPKCLVPVAGKPVLQYNVEWLQGHGITDMAVNLHHRPDAVREFLGTGERFGVSVTYSYEPELLGTAGAVDHLRAWLEADDFLVLYADNILRCDVARFIRKHRSLHAILTMALFWRADVSASGVAQLAPDGRLERFVEKPAPGKVDGNWVNAGLLCCAPSVLDFIPRDAFSDFGRDVFPSLIAAGKVVGGYEMSETESLHWIDTPADLAATEAALALAGPAS